MRVVDDLAGVLDELVGLDAGVFADGEVMVALQRQFARLDAVYARAAAAFHGSGVWAPSGARSGAAWLAGTCRVPSKQARDRVRMGRAMGDLPVAGEAWLAGRVDGAHVDVLRRARRKRSVELRAAMARDEAVLVGFATDVGFAGFRNAVAYWCQVNDPGGADAEAHDLIERRCCHVSSTFDGMVRGDFELDPVRGAIVDETLRVIYDELFRVDWADARARLGREPCVEDLARTAPQRRADALVEMAIRARTAPKGGKRPRPLFSVYVDYDSAMKRLCELANGTVVAPGALLPWLTEAELERVVFDGKRRVIDLGRRRRLFRGATRRAVQLRDRQCFHPLCDLPAERCQVDHKHPHSRGGETATTNGQPACSFHNRWKADNVEPTANDHDDVGHDGHDGHDVGGGGDVGGDGRDARRDRPPKRGGVTSRNRDKRGRDDKRRRGDSGKRGRRRGPRTGTSTNNDDDRPNPLF